jgi:hypothetical protein
MSNPSNLYAEKVFSEHPLALWALDDPADYVSLISEANRNIEDTWSFDNCSVVSSSGSSTLRPQFSSSYTSQILGEVPTSSTSIISLTSPELVKLSRLDQSLETFSISSYFYSNSVNLVSVSLGFEYIDPVTTLKVKETKTFNSAQYNIWKLLSVTFDIPNKDIEFKVVIDIEVSEGGSADSDYEFYINGITIGQWSEEFGGTSLGISVSNFPNSIVSMGDYVVEASSYGLGVDSGYYLAKETSLFAKNTGIPLVYGASGATRIVENPDLPSLIIPGKGFLNEFGRYNEYTVEFWARINSNAQEPRKIFGPIASSDGLYVEPGFITLKVGDSFGSHFIGEWYRPMLLDIRVVRDSATLLINGEKVIEIEFNTESMQLPSIVSNPGNKEQDWLGFYAYQDVPEIEIDCVAIYSYQVSETLAKRRWVYGQAVESPEGINSGYGGSSAFIDYSFSNYAVNYSYPAFATWQQGSFDNLFTSKNTLNTPDYKLPEIYLDSKLLETFYKDNFEIQSGTNPFFTFRPNSSWNSSECYINFPSLSLLSDQMHSLFGVFKIEENDSSTQILFKIYNSLTGDYFSIRKDGANIDYYIFKNGEETELFSLQAFAVGQLFAVGIEIEKLEETFGGDISAFFGNPNSLRLYVGGDENGDTFKGKIYSIGFSTNYNAYKISDHFDDNGFALISSATSLLDHTASYTILPTTSYENFYLDIGVSGYWQDYMPLSYFAKYVQNDIGNEYYDLDMIQLNLDYPSPTSLFESEVAIDSFLYSDLKEDFANPEQKTYADLDNALITEWLNYEDMSQKSIKQFSYNTSKSAVKSYITFQYIDEGANLPQSHFTTTHSPSEARILDMDENPNWYTTRFEVLDNTIIYPSRKIDFNEIAIVYTLEFESRGILAKPIKLKNFSLASQVFSNNSFTPIGTKFGNDIYPYVKSGISYDYKTKNPFSIYKGSTPYLYMTKDSGIEIRGSFDDYSTRGLSFPINNTQSSNYEISAIQVWYRNGSRSFSAEPAKLFEIEYESDAIDIYCVAINQSGSRAKIFAIQRSTNLTIESISYYINGRYVSEPVITISEWSVIGMSFANSLSFDLFLGSFNITGPGLFNNISSYQASDLRRIQSKITRPWVKVYEDNAIEFTWDSWRTSPDNDTLSWDNMLTVSTIETYTANPAEIYNTYIGTNKIIIDDSEGMVFDAEKLRVFESVEWSSATVVAV